jgi:hypothetical protein
LVISLYPIWHNDLLEADLQTKQCDLCPTGTWTLVREVEDPPAKAGRDEIQDLPWSPDSEEPLDSIKRLFTFILEKGLDYYLALFWKSVWVFLIS